MRRVATLIAIAMMLGCGLSADAKKAPKADNTAQNRGATDPNAVTADKQGNARDQIVVLADIRKTIVGDPNLSMDAKNIKILYSKGIVILRGPVNSEQEKVRVEEIAKSIEGVGGVKNLVTVAVKPH